MNIRVGGRWCRVEFFGAFAKFFSRVCLPLMAGHFLLEAALLTEINGARFGGGGTVGGPVIAGKETVATELVGSGGGGMFGGECRSG